MTYWRRRYFRFYQLTLLLHDFYRDQKKPFLNRHKGPPRGCTLSRESLSDLHPFLDPETFSHSNVWAADGPTKHKVCIGQIYNPGNCAKDIAEWKEKFPDDFKMPAFHSDEWFEEYQK